MKIRYAILCAGLGLSWTVRAEDMTTLAGQTYSNIVVQRYDGQGYFIRHDGGTNQVPYAEISHELRGHYKALSLLPIPATRLSGEKEEPAGPNDLQTLSGQVYRNVVLKQVDEDSILIAHDTGMARVGFTAIPPALHEKYRTGTPVAPDPAPDANDLVAAYGQVFRNVEFLRTEPDGLTFRHDGGVTKLGFPALPEELRQKHGYDPIAGWRYRREVAAQKALDQMLAAPESQGPATFSVFEILNEALPDNQFRISFAVRNLTDQALSIVATPQDGKMIALMTRTIEIPARAEGKRLQFEVPSIQPRILSISSGTYRTNCLLNW